MAFEITLDGNENPIGTDPITMHARDANREEDAHAGYGSIQFRAWVDRDAYDSGKQSIGTLSGVAFGPNPTPAVYNQQTGALVSPAKPTWAEVRAVFGPEFAYIDAIWHVLAKRYDPQLAGATEVAPLPDPAIQAEVEQRLDDAGLTGLSEPTP